MRLPIASPLVSRDGAANKDARLTNMLKESDGGRELAVVRPGLVLDAVASGVGNGLVTFNDELVGVYGSTLYQINPFSVVGGRMPVGGGLWSPPSWNGTVYCSVSAGTAYAAISVDGLLWRRTSLPALRGWNAIEWNGSVFCAVANTVATDKCATSPDGVTWTERTMSSVRRWSDIAWDGTVFCATSDDLTIVAVSNDDGVTWSDVTLPSESSASVCSINNTLIVSPKIGQSSGFVCISEDQGDTWLQIPISGLNPNNAYRFGVFGTLLFMLPSDVSVQTPSNSAFVSNDFGFTWNTMIIPSCYYTYKGAANNYRFVATANLGFSGEGWTAGITTTDGVTWDTFDLPQTMASGVLVDDYYTGTASDGNGFALTTRGYDGCVSIPGMVTLGTVTDSEFDFAQSPL